MTERAFSESDMGRRVRCACADGVPLACAAMPKFVMLSTLGPEGSARLSENPERLREVSGEVEAMGVKVLAQYALLGSWDFLNILEAPDEKTMMRVATTLSARGTLKTLTMAAAEVEDYIAALKATPT